MLRRSTSLVGIPDLPEDYELRQYRVDDEVAYKDLFNLGFAGDRLGHTLTHTLDDGFFVIDHTASRQVVASCVALLCSWDDGRERGILGWLIVYLYHRPLGLGTLAAGHTASFLLLDADPQRDLLTLSRPVAVYLDGVRIYSNTNPS